MEGLHFSAFYSLLWFSGTLCLHAAKKAFSEVRPSATMGGDTKPVI